MSDSRVTARFAAIVFTACFFASPRIAGAVVLESLQPCQKVVAKGARVLLGFKLKTLSRCGREDLSSPGGDACADPRVTGALSKTDTKLGDAIAKGCSSLNDTELSDPRPGGLALTSLPLLPALVQDQQNGILDGLLHAMHGPGGSGTPLSEAAIDCQTALDKAVAKRVSGAFKRIGSSCHNLEDKGKSVTGDVSQLVEACLELRALELEADAAKIREKTLPRCTAPAIAELAACPTLTSDRSAQTVLDCLLARATEAAAASLAAAHGRSLPRVIGRVVTGIAGDSNEVGTCQANAVHYGIKCELGQCAGVSLANDRGGVDIAVPPLETINLCFERAGVTSCSTQPIEVGAADVQFGERRIDFPVGPGEQAVAGRVLRSDGSPCFDADADANFALQGGVVVSPTGTPPGGDRMAVCSSGEFIVAVPTSGPYTLHADCGDETVSIDLGPPPFASHVDIPMTNPLPTDVAVAMTDDMGTPITDPSQVSPGDVITLGGSATDGDALEFHWEITRGDGRFLGVNGDGKRASGANVSWEVGGADGIHQVTMWVSDLRGGLESIVAPVGPIVGPFTPGPCIAGPKLQKQLCGTGYTASVPTPAGGLSDFLSYKYRNASRNSAGDACLYYNLVDPDCIDMNCDGVVDAGTDPTGKCKRTTLGGWWQKNGFDTNGLGTDVVSAWYLNSNDLGFGREMHCRVTSWSSIIAERPAAAPTSASRFAEALRSELVASPKAAQFSKLFNLYPSTVACYVTNYTTDHCFNYPTNDPHNANLAYQGQIDFVANPTVNPANTYGTVAMEFGPVEGFADLGAVTKFFVYNGRTAAGKRLTSANLDGCGPKSVPELCMSCHGGSWPGEYSQQGTLNTMVAGLSGFGGVLAGIDASDTISTDAGYILRKSILDKITHEEYGYSSFLPFDPDTYVFPAAAPSATQAPNIRSLNQLVLYTKPVAPIRDLIKGWYSNNLLSGTFAPWRPTAWNDDGSNPGDESDLHDEVYAKACRVCHAAHYSFSSALSFPMSARICKNGSGLAGGTPTMPHAKLTYLNLWKGDFPQALTMPTVEAWYTANEGSFLSCD